ncbi:hypothetical protein PIB30_033150 [Stylosanthes scabra]|uniref:Uncharacterized protein n=1 Tax=Stylosanthes scabra TaxID=79078 RepID=A0ABU6XA23_9FABA|nr:hypothetical protein [Stylosanthes scabra]
MTPQLTSYVGRSCITPQFDKGCTLYGTASRQTWAILATRQWHHVMRGAPTSYTNPTDSKFESARFCLLKKRKGKVVAQSSSEVPRFKTPFHEAHFKGKRSTRKVLPEVAIDYNDDILSPCAIQIKMRKWEKFTAPLQAVGHNLVKEFYANA